MKYKDFLVPLAKQAGQIMRANFALNMSKDWKGDGTPVTVTDIQINKLVKTYGNYEFTPKTTSYGIRVMEWVTPFGTIHMKRHPLFSYEVTNRNTMVIFDPQDVRYRFIDDTTFYDDPAKKNTGWSRRDGTKEEFLTEAGQEYHHPEKTGYLNGFGSDNGNP